MRLRLILWSALLILHGLALAFPPDVLSPVLAASIYLPLTALQALGLPVFALGQPGGWASPSSSGWAAASIFWALAWWGVAALATYPARRRAARGGP